MTNTNIAKYITRDDEGFYLNIALDEEFAGVKVTSVHMYIAKEAEDDCYFDGDLAVAWAVDGLENTGGGDMGSLIMRGSNDEVGEVMGEFYWNHSFDERLQEILLESGFSAEAATDVNGSEWGMQDEGRASYDAGTLANEVRSIMLQNA